MPAVTIVGPWPPPYGGVSVHVARLVRSLPRDKWSVTVISAGANSSHPGDPSLHLRNSPLRHATVPFRKARGVVHLHERISVLTAITAYTVRARRLPLVLTIHGEPRRTIARTSGVDPFLRAASRLADVVIPVSEDVAARFRSIVEPEKLRVLPAFLPPRPEELAEIDPELLRWVEFGAPGLPLITTVVYRLLPPIFGSTDVYGVRDLAALGERLAQGSVPARLLLLLALPPQSDAERGLLAEVSRRLTVALGTRFRLCVGVQAAPVLARSQLMLRPTRADGDSVAVREALALGVPVIATDAAPRPPGAVVLPVGDIEAMVSCTIRALNSSNARASEAHSHYSCLDEIVQIYTALSRTGRHTP